MGLFAFWGVELLPALYLSPKLAIFDRIVHESGTFYGRQVGEVKAATDHAQEKSKEVDKDFSKYVPDSSTPHHSNA